MIARRHRSVDATDRGFTLVELLVVIIVIGVLAGIAVPVYIDQTRKAKDSAAKSDLSDVRVAVASVLTENAEATDVSLVANGTTGRYHLTTTGGTPGPVEVFQASPGVTVSLTGSSLDDLCIGAVAAGGKASGGFSTDMTGYIYAGNTGCS